MSRCSIRPWSCGSRAALLPFLALIASACGCGHHLTTAPDTLESSSLSGQLLGSDSRSERGGTLLPWHRQGYPLAVGNSWDYIFRTSYTIVTNGQAATTHADVHRIHDELVGVEQRGTRDYFVLEQSHSRDGRTWEGSYALLRQDSGGLFVVLPSFYGPDTRAAPGSGTYARALPGELTAAVDRVPATAAHRESFHRAAAETAEKLAMARHSAAGPTRATAADVSELRFLSYPLFVGARWAMSEVPHAERTVTARERVHVPAGSALAWRVRTTSGVLGDEDRVEGWYSAAGTIRYREHVESNVVDDQNNIIGTLTYESDQRLTALRLVDPRRHPRAR